MNFKLSVLADLRAGEFMIWTQWRKLIKLAIQRLHCTFPVFSRMWLWVGLICVENWFICVHVSRLDNKKNTLLSRVKPNSFLFVLIFFLKGILKNKWSILYLLLSLSEDPRKQSNKVSEETFVSSEKWSMCVTLDVIKNHYLDLEPTPQVVFVCEAERKNTLKYLQFFSV